jgi:hypothetical protein
MCFIKYLLISINVQDLQVQALYNFSELNPNQSGPFKIEAFDQVDRLYSVKVYAAGLYQN